MPRLSPCVAAKGAALVFRRRIPARIHQPAPPLRLSWPCGRRPPGEAGRRAAMLNALAEVAWAMELPDDQVHDILRALVARVADRYIDKRLAGFLCEVPDEVAHPAVGKRWRGGSWGNCLTAVRRSTPAARRRGPSRSPRRTRGRHG